MPVVGAMRLAWLDRYQELSPRHRRSGPAVIVAITGGESGTAQLLILSQVILSLQLSFAVFPLVMFTSSKMKMGEFVNPTWLKVLAYLVATVIATLNVWLLFQTVRIWLA